LDRLQKAKAEQGVIEQKDFSHVEPRLASTVLLTRDGDNGIEVFMVKRHHKIDFASGAMVFPGGKVDDDDNDPALKLYSRGGDTMSAEQFSLAVAALRETFEECGVLLARPRGEDDLVTGQRLVELEPWATRMRDNEATMLEFVEAENLDLALDLLVHFAHWVTPPLMPKRFDTHFYLVAAPADQIAVHDGSESVDSVWADPLQTIAAANAREVTLVFATRMNLNKLAASNTAEQAFETARQTPVVRVMPKLLSFEDGIRKLEIPADAGYGGTVFEVLDKPAMPQGVSAEKN
jgi:8-oxo-dGTP pyrophosphatase MutT (NUDIX family)